MATLPFLTREEQDRQNRMNMMMAANDRRILPDAHIYPEGAVPIGPNNAPPMSPDEARRLADAQYEAQTREFEQTRNKYEADFARLNMGNEMVGKSTMTDLAQGLMPLVEKISNKRFPTEMPQTQNPLAPTFNAMENASGTSSVPVNAQYTGASTGEFGVPTEPPSAGFNPFFGVGIDPRSPSSTTNVPPIGSVGEEAGSQLVPQEITPKPQQGFSGQLPMPDMAIPMDQGTDLAIKNLAQLGKSGAPAKVVEQLKEEANDVIKSKDPYRWNNFFANAAIAFNTLRDPRMRDADLTKVMSERIKTNRALYTASRTADQIEAIGTPQSKLLADAVRNRTITAKDAFTAIYKNKSMPQELLAMMENDPDSFAKIAPFLAGQGFGTMQSSILSNALKLVDDSRTTAQSSADVFRGVERIQSVIAEFAGETGPWAETKKNILQTLAGYGINFNESYLADAQSLDSASNALVAAQLRLNKGPQTDFDALFTQSFIPSLKNTTAANQKMISYMKSNSLVDMLIDQAVQSVELSTNNPSAYQKSVKDVLSLRSNKDIGVIIKVKDADSKTGQEAIFKTFEEFVNDYKSVEPQASPLEILNSWKDITQKAKRSLKTKAL